MRPRIRTLKPEIWSDEKVGRLPVQTRLLFVGLITMADDAGRVRELLPAINGHVFPYDPVNLRRVKAMLDELAAARLVKRYDYGEDHLIELPGWHRHQRINRPSTTVLPPPPPTGVSIDQGVFFDNGEPPRENGNRFKKAAIPEKVRRTVARAHGAVPGESTPVQCHWCGAYGTVHWPRLASGRVGSWVSLTDLEFDHVEPELLGGPTTEANLVLACQKCNRTRGHRTGTESVSAG